MTTHVVEAPRISERRYHPVAFGKQLVTELREDNITDLGAMMAYYAVLALFPMLVFIVTIALLVLDEQTVRQGVAMATEAMPPGTSQYIADGAAKFMHAAHAGFAIGSAALALWGASRGAVAMSTALNAIFRKKETRSWFRRQAVGIGVTVGVALLVVLALGILVIGPIVGHWLSDRFGLGGQFDRAWEVARWVGAGLLMIVVLAVVYRFLPDVKLPFKLFTPGAIIAVLLWLAISFGFSIYLGHFNSYETTYGALGTAIVFLTWLWLSNIAILFGAEVNDVLASRKALRGETKSLE